MPQASSKVQCKFMICFVASFFISSEAVVSSSVSLNELQKSFVSYEDPSEPPAREITDGTQTSRTIISLVSHSPFGSSRGRLLKNTHERIFSPLTQQIHPFHPWTCQGFVHRWLWCSWSHLWREAWRWSHQFIVAGWVWTLTLAWTPDLNSVDHIDQLKDFLCCLPACQ